MSWWSRGQVFCHPVGKETIVRIGSQLFVKRDHENRFRPLRVTHDESALRVGIGILHFEDPERPDDIRLIGTLVAEEGACVVTYNHAHPVTYRTASLNRAVRGQLPTTVAA